MCGHSVIVGCEPYELCPPLLAAGIIQFRMIPQAVSRCVLNSHGTDVNRQTSWVRLDKGRVLNSSNAALPDSHMGTPEKMRATSTQEMNQICQATNRLPQANNKILQVAIESDWSHM